MTQVHAVGRNVLARPQHILTNVANNLARWILVVCRAPRARPPRFRAGALAGLTLAIAVVVASMFLLDTAASDWALQLPKWVTGPADEITNFGLSGRFLYPLGVIILVLAALIGPWLSPLTRGVLGALAARAGFLFIAIALPSLFDTIVKRLIGRARPYIEPHGNPFFYKPFSWSPEYASMPSGHATTAVAAAIAIGALWPRARIVDVGLRAHYHVHPRRHQRPPSERCYCRRIGRRDWRSDGAPLVCGARPGVLRRRLAALPGTFVASSSIGRPTDRR